MSLAVLQVARSGVRLVTDTACFTHAGLPASLATKADLMPHIRAVMCGRGIVELHIRAVFLLHTRYLPDVEAAVACLGAEMPALAERYAVENGLDDGDTLELLLAGWSPTQKTWCAFKVSSRAGFSPEQLAHGVHLIPSIEGYKAAELPFERLLGLAKTLHQGLSATHELEGEPGRLSSGGDLMLHELTSAGATVRKVGSLPGKAELIARMEERRLAT